MVMQDYRIGIILQARMGSTRLPGKVLKPLAGKPMIQWIIERLKICKRTDVIVLATSDLDADTPLADFAAFLGIAVFRGSESDVLDRYYRCAMQFGLDYVVRATGDNPFVDAVECDRLVDFYFSHKLDYASSLPEFGSGFPVGIGAEIMSLRALERAWREGHEVHHREHVNEYIHERPHLFRQGTLKAPQEKCAPEQSFTVDTIEQFDTAEALLNEYLSAHIGGQITTEWLVRFSRDG